jgi:hypothetical protein
VCEASLVGTTGNDPNMRSAMNGTSLLQSAVDTAANKLVLLRSTAEDELAEVKLQYMSGRMWYTRQIQSAFLCRDLLVVVIAGESYSPVARSVAYSYLKRDDHGYYSIFSFLVVLIQVGQTPGVVMRFSCIYFSGG